jgi:hypothetical protein
MFVFPSLSCGWSGFAMVGGRDSWNNASLDLRTVTHEVGHNLGLQHARMLACAGTTVGGTCSSSEYGHMIDMMGRGTGHFHPYQKERLGWVGSGTAAPITTVESSGTYVIAPYAVNNGGNKALRILRSTDSNGRRSWYYLEFRRPIGFDAFMTQYTNSNLAQGPIFTLNNESDSRENYQLDMNPSTTSFGDSALAAGQSYTDLVAGVAITTLSADSTGTVVSVNFSGSPTPSPTPSPSPSPSPAPQCTLANPDIAANPAAVQSVSRGGVVAYSLSIRNNNGTDCGANSFELSTFAPAGWTVTSSKPTITISPGATATASVSVSPGQTSNTGPATVTFRVVNSADPGFAATVSRDLQVSTSLAVEVSPSSAVYSPGQTVMLRATVRHDGIPVAGVAVSFTINGPSRRAVSLSGTTDSSGNAAASYRYEQEARPRGSLPGKCEHFCQWSDRDWRCQLYCEVKKSGPDRGRFFPLT